MIKILLKIAHAISLILLGLFITLAAIMHSGTLDLRKTTPEKVRIISMEPHPNGNDDILIKAEVLNKTGSVVSIKVNDDKLIINLTTQKKAGDTLDAFIDKNTGKRSKLALEIDSNIDSGRSLIKFFSAIWVGLLLLTFPLYKRR